MTRSSQGGSRVGKPAQPLSATCTVCKGTWPVTPEFAANARAAAADAGYETSDAQIVGRAMSEAAWLLYDTDENFVPTCPECVEATKVEKARRTCPAWCVTDHAAEKQVGDWSFCHVAPVGGEAIVVGRWDLCPIFVEVNTDMTSWSIPSDEAAKDAIAWLRELAAGALAAAEWLEAGR